MSQCEFEVNPGVRCQRKRNHSGSHVAHKLSAPVSPARQEAGDSVREALIRIEGMAANWLDAPLVEMDRDLIDATRTLRAIRSEARGALAFPPSVSGGLPAPSEEEMAQWIVAETTGLDWAAMTDRVRDNYRNAVRRVRAARPSFISGSVERAAIWEEAAQVVEQARATHGRASSTGAALDRLAMAFRARAAAPEAERRGNEEVNRA